MKKSRHIILIFILISFLFTIQACKGTKFRRVPCKIISSETYETKGDPAIPDSSNICSRVNVSYEWEGKTCYKEFLLTGSSPFKEGDSWFCYVHREKPEYVRLEDKGDIGK